MFKKLLLGAALIPTLIWSSGASAEVLTYGAPIPLETAKKIASAAIAEAQKNKFTLVVAIVDSSSTLTYLEKIDGTQIGSVEVAIDKARTANNFKRSTKVFSDGLASGRNILLNLPDAMLMEGGQPIIIDGKIVGAIGVSGASPAQDDQVATAALEVLKAK